MYKCLPNLVACDMLAVLALACTDTDRGSTLYILSLLLFEWNKSLFILNKTRKKNFY